MLKLVLAGDSCVGKSSLLSRFVRDTFGTSWKATIGAEFAISLDAKLPVGAKAQIWDTSGQDRLRSPPETYYRDAIGVVLVFDLSKKHTLEDCLVWLAEIKTHGNHPKLKIILVGNKSDLTEEREVSTKEGEAFANQHNLLYVETSALDRTNVDSAFQQLVEQIVSS